MSMTNINEPLEPLNILYICTHNRCRSALSEAITNQLGEGLLLAKSAGSQPAGEVHPLTLKYLTQVDYDIAGLTSNSWQDTDYMGNFQPDVVITVCDNAAGESCPLWLGATPKLHWGLSDPSKETTDEAKTAANFQQAIAAIEQRVTKLLAVAQLPSEQRLKALTELIQ